MTLHPRLQQPTLESPVRRGHSFTLAVALTVLAAGFAYAMPRTVLTNADADRQQDEVVLSPTGSSHTSTATTPTPKQKKTKAKDEAGDEGGTERAENHGAAVSTAAHCELEGKAHGEFVRSIAHDKDATVAEVEAACAAAQAAAATAIDSDDAVKKHGPRSSKPPKVKPHDDTDSEDVDADDDDDSEEDASVEAPTDDDDSGHGGPPKDDKNKD